MYGGKQKVIICHLIITCVNKKKLGIKVIKMSVNELLEQWLFEYACRHCLHSVLSGNNFVFFPSEVTRRTVQPR